MKNLLASTALLALVVTGISGLAHAEPASLGATATPTVNTVVGQTDASVKEGLTAVSDKKAEVKATMKVEQTKLDKKLDKSGKEISERKEKIEAIKTTVTTPVAPTATLDSVKTPAVDAATKATNTVSSSITDGMIKATK